MMGDERTKAKNSATGMEKIASESDASKSWESIVQAQGKDPREKDAPTTSPSGGDATTAALAEDSSSTPSGKHDAPLPSFPIKDDALPFSALATSTNILAMLKWGGGSDKSGGSSDFDCNRCDCKSEGEYRDHNGQGANCSCHDKFTDKANGKLGCGRYCCCNAGQCVRITNTCKQATGGDKCN
mmetsp:Transcript_12590/g.30637  ORF Transcript_12590/g.30637 Transcript_12590/m.30637 type:complete len:184 (-) Transcript_12590:1136-1687(-)